MDRSYIRSVFLNNYLHGCDYYALSYILSYALSSVQVEDDCIQGLNTTRKIQSPTPPRPLSLPLLNLLETLSKVSCIMLIILDVKMESLLALSKLVWNVSGLTLFKSESQNER